MNAVALRQLVVSCAIRHALPPDLVGGMVQVESSGNNWAINPEPKYRYLWDVKRSRTFRAPTAAEIASEFPPRDFPAPAGVDPDAEWWSQQMSWGLMQVMGGVARERGLDTPYVSVLNDPEVGLEFGCRVMARNLRRWPAVDEAVAAYNGGSPRMDDPKLQEYVRRVRAARAAWA